MRRIKAGAETATEMKRMRNWITALILAGAVAGCAASREDSPDESMAAPAVAEGKRLAEVHCARCHAIGAEGESRHPEAPHWRTLSRNYPLNSLEEAFAEGILVGHRDMPPFEFEPAQIDALVAYLNTIQEHRAG